MSDGDRESPDATPSHRRDSECDGDNQWLTRTPRPSLGAAPWERSGIFQSVESGGNHTDGVSVADLIAKIADEPLGRRAKNSDEPLGRRAKSSDEPLGRRAKKSTSGRVDERPTSHHRLDASDDEDSQDAATARLPVVPSAEIPDLARRATNADEPLARRATSTDEPLARRATRRAEHTLKSKSAKPPRRQRHRIVLAGRLAAALLSVMALLLTGAAWQWSASKNNRLKFISALDPDSRDIVDPNAQFGDENFLIVGVDSRYGQNADMGAGDTEDAGGARSDTVMLVNIPANRERVVAVSFPRDLAITPMRCQAWDPSTGKYGPVYDDETGTYGPDQVYTETKLNSAYSFGGPKCLVKVIQKLSGLSINRFMAIDFAGFAKLVDTLGGVKVCSTTPLKDYELGTVLPKAGWQTIDGRTALNYVRARQVTTETNGDYGRIKRQQLFLSSLLRSLISNEVFFSLSKLNSVVNTFINDSAVDNVKTKDLVDLGQSIQGITAGHVTFLTVPTGETDSEGNEPLRTQDNRALFDAIINDDPLPGENNQNETTSPTTKSGSTPLVSGSTPSSSSHESAELMSAVTTEPQHITVHVSNSTGQDGLATTAAEELEQQGFNVTTPDDYPRSLTSTTVFFSPGNERAAATVASTLAHPKIERVSGMGDVVQVVLGSDFNTVGAPSPTGSSVQVPLTHGTTSTPTALPQDLSVTNAADVTCE
ncbi:MAG TPA: LCP family protein [Mycobacterium sp.]|jgi:LCP family protein required for cell wall assembly